MPSKGKRTPLVQKQEQGSYVTCAVNIAIIIGHKEVTINTFSKYTFFPPMFNLGYGQEWKTFKPKKTPDKHVLKKRKKAILCTCS